jgi:hypothetical protein
MFENVELKRIDIKLIEKYMPKFRKEKSPAKTEEPEDQQEAEEESEITETAKGKV